MNKAQRISRSTMIRAAAIMEFLRANANSTAQVVADNFNIRASTARYALDVLVNGDKVEKIHHNRVGRTPSPDTFIIGGDATPLEIIGDNPLFTIDLKEPPDTKHISVKAVQLGLKRDSMIEAFYGPARTQAPA
jgi:hypothetical protein